MSDVPRRSRRAYMRELMQRIRQTEERRLMAADSTIQFYVYCTAYKEDGPTKVGFTTNVGRRLAELQWGIPYPLTIHFAYRMPNETEARQIEYNILDHYADYRLNGEWVDQAFGPVRSLIIEKAEHESVAARAFNGSASMEEIEFVQRRMLQLKKREETKKAWVNEARRKTILPPGVVVINGGSGGRKEKA